MYTNHRHLILLFFAVGAITLTIFGYASLRKIILDKAIHSSQIIKEVSLVDRKKQHEEDIASIYARSAAEREELSSLIVQQDKVVGLIEEVEKIGEQAGVNLDLSSISNEDVSKVKKNKLGHFLAHVEGRGPWANIMRTLVLIENMPHNVSINNIHLAQISDAPSEEAPVEEGMASTTVVVPKKPVIKAKSWVISLDIKVLTTK